MRPKIIGLVGPIRAGKTFVASYLEERYGYKLASNSDLLRDIAKNLEIVQTRENLKKLGDSIFKVLGNDTIARFRLSSIQEFPIVVDGIRYKEEVNTYMQEPSFKLIGITAPEEIRFQRAITLVHEGKDREIDRDQFSQLSFARSELQVKGLLNGADIFIENTGSKDALFEKIDQLALAWNIRR